LVDVARTAAIGTTPPHRPWLPPLPSSVDLDTVQHADVAEPVSPHRVPVGLLDLPDEQRQSPLTIDLGEGGTVLVAGSARSGRSTLLRTLAVSAATQFRPDQLHIHAIDAGGSGLTELAALPHIGTIATARNGFELTARLVTRLARTFSEARDRGHGEIARPRALVLLDGWEAFAAGAEEYDGGRTVDRLHALLGDAPGARGTVVVTGGRAVLAPRLIAHAATRLVLACHDSTDYAAAGLDVRSAPPFRAGRGLRAGDGAEFQLALAAVPQHDGRPDPTTLRLRSLPARIALTDLPGADDHVVFGVGGDDAGVVRAMLELGAGRLLVAGPARSGRSQFLITVLHQSLRRAISVAAPVRSPLAIAARRHGVRLAVPGDAADIVDVLPHLELLLIDDMEDFANTDLGDSLARCARTGPPGLIMCAAGRSETLAVAFRGLGSEMRRARSGVLLQPGAADGELFGVRLPRARVPQIPGRGLFFPDPAWTIPDAPIPIQLALSPCADTCGPLAGRRSP
jgi:S-DNA-T family DNA segregation ATPase FtsK/SpoIIIE